MKKILSLVCSAIFASTILSACGGTPNVGDTTSPTKNPTSNQSVDNSWELVEQKNELVVGLDDTFAPMGFRDESGNLVGFDIDFANAVGEQLNVKIKFQPIVWDTKEMELNGKNIDCLWNGLSQTPERAQSMSLTRPYLNNKLVIMSVKDVDIKSKDDLEGLTIGIQAKSSALEVLQEDPIYDKVKDKVSEYESYDNVILDMQAGRIKATIIDVVLGQYKNTMLKDQFDICPVEFADDQYVVGLRKNDAALTKKLQEAIDAVIASGEAAKISEKWFGSNIVLDK